MSILEKNQKAFSAQSEGFSSDGQTYAKLEEVDWMLQELPLTEQSRALDIATGT
jgi:protein-L-isoaspartate O-methyltransferase